MIFMMIKDRSMRQIRDIEKDKFSRETISIQQPIKFIIWSMKTTTTTTKSETSISQRRQNDDDDDDDRLNRQQIKIN